MAAKGIPEEISLINYKRGQAEPIGEAFSPQNRGKNLLDVGDAVGLALVLVGLVAIGGRVRWAFADP
jgi:hypothetical protein